MMKRFKFTNAAQYCRRLDPAECLDNVVIFGDRHLRRQPLFYVDYHMAHGHICRQITMRRFRGLITPLVAFSGKRSRRITEPVCSNLNCDRERDFFLYQLTGLWRRCGLRDHGRDRTAARLLLH
jgi:hypothetical protein